MYTHSECTPLPLPTRSNKHHHNSSVVISFTAARPVVDARENKPAAGNLGNTQPPIETSLETPLSS